MIKFKDHCVGFDSVVDVFVMGWVYYEDEHQVKLTHWKEEHPDWIDSIEKCCVLKKVILDKWLIG